MARRTSNCARSSAAGLRAWGFVELDALRVEHDLSVAGFCRAVGLPRSTYYDRRARHAAGHHVRGRWPTPARDEIRARVVELALKYPMWGHRKIAWLARHDGAEMTTMVAEFRELYNRVGPHEYLQGDRPTDRYLAEPAATSSSDPITPLPTRQTVRIP